MYSHKKDEEGLYLNWVKLHKNFQKKRYSVCQREVEAALLCFCLTDWFFVNRLKNNKINEFRKGKKRRNYKVEIRLETRSQRNNSNLGSKLESIRLAKVRSSQLLFKLRWEPLVGIAIRNEGRVRGLNVVYLLMLHYTEYITGERSRECSSRGEGRTLVQFKGSRVSSKCCVLVYKPCM